MGLWRTFQQWRTQRKWKAITRLEAMSLLIARDQAELPPATRYRIDQLTRSNAVANPPARRDPQRQSATLRRVH
jgi:hypothetical protein